MPSELQNEPKDIWFVDTCRSLEAEFVEFELFAAVEAKSASKPPVINSSANWVSVEFREAPFPDSDIEFQSSCEPNFAPNKVD